MTRLSLVIVIIRYSIDLYLVATCIHKNDGILYESISNCSFVNVIRGCGSG